MKKKLEFLQRIFSKCHLQLLLLDLMAPPDRRLDLGLRTLFGKEELYEDDFYELFRNAQCNTLYYLTDQFSCHYIFFLLPDEKRSPIVILGPYMTTELTHEHLLEQAEKYSIPPGQFKQIEKYFAGIPILTEDSFFLAALNTFAEDLWGAEAFTFEEIEQAAFQEASQSFLWDDFSRPGEPSWNIQTLEARYARENEILQAVSMGHIHKAKLLLSGFGDLAFERRIADRVRNLKNYCIIMNTLLRKAAEAGGVHPVYLDSLSSEFARRIETLATTEGIEQLIETMYSDYCRLVRHHATQRYSPPVQQAILHIHFDLNTDLSLYALSAAQSINASYLSALFKKETGQTVTDYVNGQRVRRAQRLLSTTKLQIQTIAQHCGISDVNYFSKIFKKHTGITPREYRKEHQPSRKDRAFAKP